MNKYFEIFRFNLKTKTNFKTNYIANIFSFALNVIVLSTVWEFILRDKLLFGYTKETFVWYILIGEFIFFSSAKEHKQIALMIKNGDIANLLTKPISIFKYVFARNAICIVNIIVNFIVAVILGLLMSGMVEFTIIQIVLFSFSLIMSIMIWVMVQIAISLTAFFIEENRSVELIIRKFGLLLIFTPLEFYPIYIQTFFKFLPTTYAVYLPAKIFTNFNYNEDIKMFCIQICMLIFMIFLNYFISLKGVKNINVNGG